MTRKSLLMLIIALAIALLAAACGSEATPEWAAEAQGTRAAMASTSEHLTAIAPTATATSLPPTATEIPPTATPIPPTATATIEPTSEPTAAPTEEATAHDEHAGMGADPGNAAAIAAAAAAGNAEDGKALFNTMQPATGFACATCHSVTSDSARIIGPGLWNVSVHGAGHVPGQNAVEYIHTSIVDPQAFIVPGDPPYPENLMPKVFSQIFSEQQISDLIAYLLSLHD